MHQQARDLVIHEPLECVQEAEGHQSVIAFDLRPEGPAHFIVERRKLGYALDEIRPMVHVRWSSADKVPIKEAIAYEKKVAEARHARHTKRRGKADDEGFLKVCH